MGEIDLYTWSQSKRKKKVHNSKHLIVINYYKFSYN